MTARVVAEHASLVRVLREEIGAVVHVFDHAREHGTPDAVFPNNWFSTDARGRVTLYPMRHPSRRGGGAPTVAWLAARHGVDDDERTRKTRTGTLIDDERRDKSTRAAVPGGHGRVGVWTERAKSRRVPFRALRRNVARAWAEDDGTG